MIGYNGRAALFFIVSWIGAPWSIAPQITMAGFARLQTGDPSLIQASPIALRNALQVADRHPSALLVCLATWVAVYFATLSSTAAAWLESGPYSHGFLSLMVCTYIAWRSRQLLVPQPAHGIASITLMLVVSAGWWLAGTANVLKLEQLAAFLLLVLIFVAVYGWRVLDTLRLPFLILLLVIPIWDFLAEPLRAMTTITSESILDLLGVPYLREGYLITLPKGRFYVEEACSGLGFLLCATMLALFSGLLSNLKPTHMIALVALSSGLAIFANWVRVVAILLVGTYAGMDSPVVTDHLTFGWIVFLVTLLPFLAIINRSARRAQPEDAPVHAAPPVPVLHMWGRVAAICLSLALVPSLGYIRQLSMAAEPDQFWSLPDDFGAGYVRLSSGHRTWKTLFPGAARVTSASYANTAGKVFTALVVQYDSQAQGRELINVSNRLFLPPWNELGEVITGFGVDSAEVRVKSLRSGLNHTRQIAYWYIVADHPTSDPVTAKILEAYGAVTGTRRAFLFAIAVDNDPDPSRLLQIVGSLYPGIDLLRSPPGSR